MDSIYELKQRMTLLERAHASAGMGHFVLDPKRKAIEFSSWVRDHIGLNDMPIPLDRFPEIVVEEEREEFSCKIREAIDRKQDFSFEINVVTANGEVRTQRISGITAFENEHTREGLIGYFGILQEITHEKRSNEELRKARDSAQAQLEARTNLLAVVSHEIRTPLSGILGIIDQLKRERSPAERERALAVIEDSSEVLLDTLDAILQQARIGGDTANLETTRFLPISIALRVAELFRPLARRKGLRIEVAGPSVVYALGDPTRLQQVIANFVSNAVKFTQSGIVSITVTEPVDEGNEWVFTISDTGSGMDESRLAGIFDPFGTSNSDSLGRSVGAGLGLSITRDLVEVMGGRIQVESEPGRGGDVALIAENLLTRIAAEEGKKIEGFSKASDAYLEQHDWPGNVRELQNALRRAVITGTGKQVELAGVSRGASRVAAAVSIPEQSPSFHPNITDATSGMKAAHFDFADMTLDEVERIVIEQAISRTRGNIVQAAKSLGVSPSTIYRKLERWSDS